METQLLSYHDTGNVPGLTRVTLQQEIRNHQQLQFKDCSSHSSNYQVITFLREMSLNSYPKNYMHVLPITHTPSTTPVNGFYWFEPPIVPPLVQVRTGYVPEQAMES
jgi:hypothetical protein